MKQFDELLSRYNSLSQRDQKLSMVMAVVLFITFFYLSIWEPLHLKRDKQKINNTAQMEIHHWMENAAAEVRQLKASGNQSIQKQKTNSPVSIVIEQSTRVSGLKKHIDKIESSGKNSAQIKLKDASFNQMLLWINTLKTRYGINISSAKIERTDKEGIINARLTLRRS